MNLRPHLLPLIASFILTASAIAAEPATFPAVKPLMAERVASIEHDIAALILHRAETPAAQQPVVDLQIDLRILERWLLLQASDAKPESEQQIQAFLRSSQLATASDGLEDALKQSVSHAMTHTQSEAMLRLHQLTYNLPDGKGTASADGKPALTLDDVCRQTGEAMLDVISPQPIDPKAVPVMRPHQVFKPAHAGQAPEPADGPRDRARATDQPSEPASDARAAASGPSKGAIRIVLATRASVLFNHR